MQRTIHALITGLASLAFIPITQAQYQMVEPGAAVTTADVVMSVGTVTSIENMAINDDGSWVVEVDTDNADTDADGAMLKDGVLLLREGQALAAPAGASVGSFDACTLDNRGDSGWNLFLDGTTGFGDDSGVFLGDTLLFQEGAAASAPGLTPGSPWLGFFDVKKNDSRQMLVLGTVDDPAIASSVDQVLVRVRLSPTGSMLGQTVIAKEGDLLPGQTEAVALFRTGPHDFAFNDAGEAMFTADLEGPTASDHAIYVGSTLVAQEGSPSPVAGRNWSSLSLARVDLNNCGGYVFTGSLDGDAASNAIIVKNGAKLVQEGDSLPAIAPFTFTSFGSGPVWIGENGKVLWYGQWNDPDTTVNKGLFLDDELIVQEGVSTVGGVIVDTLRGIQDGYVMSPFGDRVMFEAVLADATQGAFTLGTGPWKGLGLGKAGTGGEVPCHTATGSLAGGSALTLDLARALPGSSAAIVFGLSLLEAPFKGGTLVPAPEFYFLGLPVDGTGELSLSLVFPVGVPAGLPIYTQFWVTDPGATGGFSASNGLAGTTS